MPYFLVPTFSGPEATVLELADTIFARRIASSIEQKEVISSTFYSYSYKLVLWIYSHLLLGSIVHDNCAERTAD